MKTRSLTEKLESNRNQSPTAPPQKKRKSNENEKVSPYFQNSSSSEASTAQKSERKSKDKKVIPKSKITVNEEKEKSRSTISKNKIKSELKKFGNGSFKCGSSEDEEAPVPVKKSKRTEKQPEKSLSGRKNDEKPTKIKPIPKNSKKKIPPKPSKKTVNEAKAVSSDSDSEWEEVESQPSANPDIPSSSKTHQPIEIIVNAPKGKKRMNMEMIIQREINKFKREKREKLHKVHLLAYFAHGIRLSRACNNPLMQSVALSLIPIGFSNIKPCDFDLDSLKKFVKWFKSAFILCQEPDEFDFSIDWENCLLDKLDRKVCSNYKLLAMTFVAMIRSMSLNSRLVLSVHPHSLKEDLVDDKITDKTKSTKKKSKTLSNGSASVEAKNNLKEDKAEKKQIADVWAEVFLESNEKWICTNFIDASVGNTLPIEEHCSQPISYILAFDSENSIKDVTARYVANFTAPNIRRQRLKDEWYEKTLKLFKTKRRLRDRLEDLELQAKLSELPMPKTINEFKNHPLYVLKRDLLKFQGIHPPETKPLGYIRNEPIYPRSAVHMLHSKETWRKDARMVRSGEEPVKIVKARPKSHVPKEEQVDRPLPLFGFWQTDPYVSPPAVDGKVPRNEYGNVELFKPSMLPAGTVYLPHPGLLQVAKKLDIDCVPAMVGWDFHAGGSHPLLEGWVVCEEFKETLIAAWDQEQAIIAERDAERKSKRSLANWKKLVKALLLREKVREKFKEKNPIIEQVTPNESETVFDEHAGSSKSWPQCIMNFNLDDHQETL